MNLAACKLTTEVVTLIDVECPMAYVPKVIDLITNHLGNATRTISGGGTVRVVGHIPGKWNQSEVEEMLSKL